MKSGRISLAVFTGTGNTLLMARVLAGALEGTGRDVRLFAMDRPENFDLPDDAALGLAVPLACFSTYPTAWRFIDSLPEGRGREAFFLATMGGMSGGMEGPIRRAVERKGYSPTGACIVKMPSNYANKTIPVEKNRAVVEQSGERVKKFTAELCGGRSSWGGGGLLAPLFARLAHGRWPWRTFYKIFPLAVDRSKCNGCGICRDICPEKNITLTDGRASIGALCESCQRCSAFCPAEAVSVPGKPAERYSSVPLEDIIALRG
jgi:ferredoxin/flavodoxin